MKYEVWNIKSLLGLGLDFLRLLNAISIRHDYNKTNEPALITVNSTDSHNSNKEYSSFHMKTNNNYYGIIIETRRQLKGKREAEVHTHWNWQ